MADDLGIDLDRAPVRSHGKARERFWWAAALWRSVPNDRNRRVSPLTRRPAEGLLTVPIAGAQQSAAGTRPDAPKPPKRHWLSRIGLKRKQPSAAAALQPRE